jgi:DNA-binding FadR family transcriptional regulator
MEVARSLGFVEARPKTGMKRLPYSFRPAVTQSLAFGMAVEPGLFQQYSDLRNHLEQAYWYQAVTLLTPDDHLYLQSLVDRAIEKINSKPPQLPHPEHRELHLIIYRRLNNPFVIGLLESYWEIYETAGLAIYTDLVYLQQVWQYHARMVSAIRNKDFEVGYQALVEHVRLIAQRKPSLPRANFE